jgi:phosphoglycerate dehydrogenase-like enzyme
MPNLRWVYWQRAGTENMHFELLKARGIALSNSGDLVSRSVAEMNLACIIAQAKKLPDHIQLQRRRRWKTLYCEDLGSQTVGIIGAGNIASQTARLCQALGMRVTAASRSPARFQGIKHPYDRIYHLHDELDVLLQEADYVVVAVPLNEETRNLIGMKQFKTMRSSATLINTARHQIVDESALCNALSSNLIAAAYLDVLFNRRLHFWDRIYRTKNLYITHYSAAHFRNRQRKALESFLYGLEHEAKTGTFPDRVV